MSAITKVKEDKFGLYLVAGGWIARPLEGTKYKKGDEVKSHHFGGSQLCGVGDKSINFRSIQNGFESWSITELKCNYINQKNHPDFDEYIELGIEYAKYGSSMPVENFNRMFELGTLMKVVM